MPTAKPTNEHDVLAALSAPRMSTYLLETVGDTDRALELYGWNARISAAMMLPAHFAEVTTRNAVDEALTAVYGPRWPWNHTFERSLPAPRFGYRPHSDLVAVRAQHPTTGKVIADLRFVFWQKMFTSRHDTRLWNPHIRTLFPNATEPSPADLRLRVAVDLDAIRQLRNRIAHHEPIFSRNLSDDLTKMLDLIQLRSVPTAGWVRTLEEASSVLSERP